MSRKLVAYIIGDSSSYERSMRRSSTATAGFGKNIGKAEKGALAGSGAFKSLGRSVAFAGASFLGAAGLVDVLKSSVEHAEQAEKAHASLAAAFKLTGDNAKKALPVIDKWANEQARFGVSAVDAETSLARLVVLTHSSSKAQLAYTAALAISKSTGRSLNAVVLASGKAFNGQTTALARYIGKIPKGLTATELFTRIMKRFGGQAAANTAESQRFSAELSNFETIIGNGILPVLNGYLKSLSKWLENMQSSGRLQKDVKKDVHDFTVVMGDAVGIVKAVDDVTGGLVHTLELLVGLKFASKLFGLARGVGLIGGAAAESEVGVAALLGPEGVLVVGAGIAAFALTSLALKWTHLDKVAKAAGASMAGAVNTKVPGGSGKSQSGKIGGVNIAEAATFTRKLLDAGHTTQQVFLDLKAKYKTLALSDLAALIRIGQTMQKTFQAAGGAATEAGAKAAHGLALAAAAAQVTKPLTGDSAGAGLHLTAEQKNTFFDNAIARILLLGGLGSITQQIAALNKADNLIKARIAATKDVTRRLKLEDELAQNAAEVRTLTVQRAQAQAQAATDRRNARQFRELGLTKTGDNVTPGKARLQKELGSLEKGVKGTPLDTKALEARMKAIRKVLAEPIIGTAVRAKIQDTLNGIRDDLKKFTGDLRKFNHQSSASFVKGLGDIGLSTAQKRAIQAAVSVRGPGGTVPGSRSLAFHATVHTTVNLDGKAVGKSVTDHQVKHNRKRTVTRAG